MESLKDPMSYVDEKRSINALEGDLPRPNIAQPDNRRRIQVIRRFILFSLCTYFAFWLVKSSIIRSPQNLWPGSEAQTDPVNGYWEAIASKGMRRALDGRKEHTAGQQDRCHGRASHSHCNGNDEVSAGVAHPAHHHSFPVSPKLAEKIYLSVPNNDSCRAASRRYTSYAHPAGSGFDFVSAINLKNEWEVALGLPPSGPEDHLYDAGSAPSQARILDGMHKIGVWIDTYYPVMNTPVSSSVTLLTDPPFFAKLQEDIVEGDPDTVLRDEVPVFHGLSVSGDVTGKYVYAGYGRKADFDLLQEKGIDFNGKIALVKYGHVFRGLKIKAAQEAGAIGVLIFTDPGDDGEVTEANGYKQYPEGPARQASSVQRGSVQFISKYPGDPSTPGEPAYKNATRAKGGNQPSIPSLPISYQDAIPLLNALKGSGIAAGELGKEWVGGLGYLGVEYFTGPSEADLHLVNEVNTRVMPIWNTMAVIPGSISDEVIIMGNHRDAWILGGSDPNSGTASQYELIRGLGALLRHGWKPLRTIVLASWDAEEYGLIGSTEWTEDFGDWLVTDAAAYLNLDSSVAGSKFGAAASPSLAWLIRNTAEDVLSGSDSSKTVWDMSKDGGDWKTWRLETYGEGEEDFEALATSETGVGTLGSGSDFTSFLQRYGVASGSMEFQYAPKDPTYHYHSIYDSFTWQDKFMDPGFHKHTDVAKVIGVVLLRLSDSLLLPLNTTQYSIELGSYLKKVEKVASVLGFSKSLDLTSLGESIDNLIAASLSLDAKKEVALERLHKLLPNPHHYRRGLFRSIARKWWQLRSSFGSSKAQSRLATMDSWIPVDNQGARFPHLPIPNIPKKIREIKAVLKEIREINKKLQGFEGGFISTEGIKEREWYKHKGVAPGLWLGYGATTFPSLTEALTIDHSPELAQKEADELTEMIDAMAVRLAD
ncbi:hypothetical protein BCR39DRAFT_518112 [Naematelia encephala]|uniref:Zn-dependent exopeptidase n=1 Tax=Naematelia encephala TaxID=71784 RepID=A0A1Y2BHE1_9TREE|nr:hypothetical protein BCR39DRAFT_518112 [Naematelia encephala]